MMETSALVVSDALQQMSELIRKGGLKQDLGFFQPGAECSQEQAKAKPVMIAKGAQGEVYKCRWQGRNVAVKLPRLGTTADMARFRKEVQLMATLGSPDTHIMPLLGARCVPPKYLLVMPLAGRSLADCLYTATPAWRPTWRQIISIATQLAGALATMHNAGVIHRDIKTDNIMLQIREDQLHGFVPSSGDDIKVFLSDLGLACHTSDLVESTDTSTWSATGSRFARPTGGFHKQDAVGTQEYCAPELLTHSATASPSSDVFAWAVTVNELATQTIPYSDCTRDGPPGLHTVLDTGYTRQQLAAAVAAEGLRPRPPVGAAPPGWVQLLDSAWAAKSEERPSAAALHERLQHMLDHVLPVWEAASKQSSSASLTDFFMPRGITTPMDRCSTPINDRACDMDVEITATPGPTSKIVNADVASSSDSEDDKFACDTTTRSTNQLSTAAEPAQARATLELGDEHKAWLSSMQQSGVSVWDCATGIRTPASQTANEAASYQPHVTAGIVESMGTRDNWEDRSIVDAHVPVPDLLGRAVHAAPYMSLLAVFDGHRGSDAAVLCQKRAGPLIRQRLGAVTGALPGGQALESGLLVSVVRDVLLDLEQEFFAAWDAERRAAAARAGNTQGPNTTVNRVVYPGCTATLALIFGNTLTVGNLGDGRAVLGGPHGKVTPIDLNRQHTAALPAERARLAAAGSPAVWHEQGGGWRLPGNGLQVSRSIGDYDAKGHAPVGSGGLTAEPEICQVQLQPQHTWLILGSDGLWDVLQPEKVSQYVADTVKHPAMCARRLVAEALDAGSNDNISAVVAFLQPVTTLEKVFSAAH